MALKSTMIDIVRALAGLLAFALLCSPAWTDTRRAHPVSVAQFEEWFRDISNWGRWGADDELGTLNLITPAKRVAAANLVRDGVVVSLALDLNKQRSAFNENPFEHALKVSEWGGHEVASDRYSVEYHGIVHSHVDGLSHFARQGKMYNGFLVDTLKLSGAEKLGIQNVASGIFARGVLIDLPWVKGVDFLEPGTAITLADLAAWEAKSGILVTSGDVVLIRTGRWERLRQKGPWNFIEQAAGSHASITIWLKARDVAALGSDGVNDVIPSNVEGRALPLHELALVGLGMPILDNLDLDTLAIESRKRGRFEFLFIGAPLRAPGGTGSPLNPLAVF